jgi:hypothetical protein
VIHFNLSAEVGAESQALSHKRLKTLSGEIQHLL